MKKSFAMQNVELRFGQPLEEVIRSLTEAGRSQIEIATELGISYFTLRGWLKTLGARTVTSVRFGDGPGES